VERLWETIKKGLQESANTAISKAEDLTRLGHSRLDIAAVKNKINQLQTELGAEVYRRHEEQDTSDLAQSATVRDLCERIGNLKEELQDKERALDELRSELAEVEEEVAAPAEPEASSQKEK
jgi:predicted RNase H-like nuclease (RuvC/YqgF family)